MPHQHRIAYLRRTQFIIKFPGDVRQAQALGFAIALAAAAGHVQCNDASEGVPVSVHHPHQGVPAPGTVLPAM
ncbi:hypothetical protein D3C85_1784720 [compost metagenome]